MSSLPEIIAKPLPAQTKPTGTALPGAEINEKNFRESLAQETRTQETCTQETCKSTQPQEVKPAQDKADARHAAAQGEDKTEEPQVADAALATVNGKPTEQTEQLAGLPSMSAKNSKKPLPTDSTINVEIIEQPVIAVPQDGILAEQQAPVLATAGTHKPVLATAEATTASMSKAPLPNKSVLNKSVLIDGQQAAINGKTEPANPLPGATLFKASAESAPQLALSPQTAAKTAQASVTANSQVQIANPQVPVTPLMPTTGGKSFKLEAWQFGNIDATPRAVAADVASTTVNNTTPALIQGTAINAPSTLPGDAAATAKMQVPVNVSFGQPQWAGMVAQRSAWLFSQNISNADLWLDPPELGRMNVNIQVHNNDQASVTFTSPNANVRDALEQSTQRLRELLSEQGLDLVNVDVSDQRSSSDRETTENDEADLTNKPDQAEITPVVQMTVNTGIDQYV